MKKRFLSLLLSGAVAIFGATSVYADGLTVGSGVTVSVNDTTLTVSDDVTISSGGTLNAGSGTINVGGNWSNSGAFSADTGTVSFVDGTSPATISNSDTFYNLSAITTTGKQLTLTASTTQTVSNSITLQGAASNLLILRSSISGTQASINLTTGKTQTISYVDVKDNNATGDILGQGSASMFNSTDSGNNTNWFINNAPVLAVNTGMTVTTNAPATTVTSSMLQVTDVDNTAAEITYTVATTTTNGTLKKSGTTLTASDTFTQDDIDSSLSAEPVDVVNIDDDTAWFVVSDISENTTETGYDAVFTVTLTSQPTADVVIELSSSDTSEGTLDLSSITFTPDNWNAPKEVVVTGVNDNVVDGHQTYTINLANVTSGDSNYNGLDPDDVTVVNTDDDTAGLFLVTPVVGEPSEEGDTATFSITLTSQPTADVTLTVSSTDTGEGTVSPSTITFTPDNWNTRQIITITGVDDNSIDGNQPFRIEFSASSSTDSNYNGLKPDNIELTNRDDDTAGFIISELYGNPTEEGGTATFTVRLASQPTADVSVTISSSDTTEGTLFISSIDFTSDNWNAPQEVVITGVNDNVADGNQLFRIEFGPSSSTDSNFNNMMLLNLNVTNIDDDSPGFIVSELSGDTNENGDTATFTVRLVSEPTADVTLGLTSSDTSEGTVAPDTLVFTSDNWNAPQVVTVTGVDDGLLDGSQSYRIEFALAVSTDSLYSGTKPRNLRIVNNDNDSAGFEISDISGNTGENGDTATFTVALTAQPTADVTIPVSVSDSTEGLIYISSIYIYSQ